MLDEGIKIRRVGVQLMTQLLNRMVVVAPQKSCFLATRKVLDLRERGSGTPGATAWEPPIFVEHFTLSHADLGEVLRMPIVVVLRVNPPGRCVDGAPIENVPCEISGQGNPREIGDAEKVYLPDPHLIEFQQE